MTEGVNNPIIWVLLDSRPGNRGQALGIAERFPFPVITKEIRYTEWVKLPNILRGASLIGVKKECHMLLQEPWPDAVISVGRRMAPVALWIKKRNPACKLIHLMWPEAGLKQFDAIVLPSHDRHLSPSDNVLRIMGAPHRVTPQILEAAKHKWAPAFSSLASPRIAVLIGGSNKAATFSLSDFAAFGKLTKELADNTRASLMVTTSRRTGREAEYIFERLFSPYPHHFHLWSQEQGKESDNPYLGYLAHADAIVVTADSIAMITEACATHKPVYIFAPENLPKKHRRFLNTLIAAGHAYPLSKDYIDKLHKVHSRYTLDSAQTIADHVLKLLDFHPAGA